MTGKKIKKYRNHIVILPRVYFQDFSSRNSVETTEFPVTF